MLTRAADRALRLTSRLLASAPVFEAVQVGLSFTLSARKRLDRGLDSAWAALNVVSYRDIEELRAELREARATIEALEGRLAQRSGPSGDGAKAQ